LLATCGNDRFARRNPLLSPCTMLQSVTLTDSLLVPRMRALVLRKQSTSCDDPLIEAGIDR